MTERNQEWWFIPYDYAAEERRDRLYRIQHPIRMFLIWCSVLCGCAGMWILILWRIFR